MSEPISPSSVKKRLPIPAPVVGMLMMAIASLAFSIMHTAIKHVGADMHAFEIAFFRVVFGFVALAPIFLRQGITPLRTTKVKLFAWRGVFNGAAMLMFFYGLTITPLATVAALGFTAPIFATLLATVVLGEAVRLRRMTAIAIGIVGTIAQTAMNQALKLGDASVVLPVDFSKLIWASILGWLIFSELPDVWTYVGGAMIFGSATYIGIRESRLKKQGVLPEGQPSTPVGRNPPPKTGHG